MSFLHVSLSSPPISTIHHWAPTPEVKPYHTRVTAIPITAWQQPIIQSFHNGSWHSSPSPTVATRNAWILGSWHQGSSRFITIRLLDTRRSPSSQSCWEYLGSPENQRMTGWKTQSWMNMYLLFNNGDFRASHLSFQRGLYDLSYYKFRHLDCSDGIPNQFISMRVCIKVLQH